MYGTIIGLNKDAFPQDANFIMDASDTNCCGMGFGNGTVMDNALTNWKKGILQWVLGKDLDGNTVTKTQLTVSDLDPNWNDNKVSAKDKCYYRHLLTGGDFYVGGTELIIEATL